MPISLFIFVIKDDEVLDVLYCFLFNLNMLYWDLKAI